MDSCLKPHKQTNSNDEVKALTSSILASRKADGKLSGKQSFIMHPQFSLDSSQPIFTSFKKDSCRAVPASQHCNLISLYISLKDSQIEKFWCSPSSMECTLEHTSEGGWSSLGHNVRSPFS